MNDKIDKTGFGRRLAGFVIPITIAMPSRCEVSLFLRDYSPGLCFIFLLFLDEFVKTPFVYRHYLKYGRLKNKIYDSYKNSDNNDRYKPKARIS